MPFQRFLSRMTPPLAGLDISQSEVVMVELSQAGDGQTHLKHYARASLPAGVVATDDMENMGEIIETVRHVRHASGSTAKRIAISIASPAAVTCVIDAADGSSNGRLEECVKRQVAQMLPCAPDQALFDFTVIGPVPSRTRAAKVVIVAARKETVEDRIAIAESLGLKAMIVESSAYALLSAMRRCHRPSGGTPPMLMMSPDTGGVHAALIDQGCIAAEQYHALPDCPRRSSPAGHYYRSGQEHRDPHTCETTSAHRDDIATCCAQAVQSLRARLPHLHAIAAMQLAGPGATIPGLISAIEARTGIAATTVAPFAGMTIAAGIDPDQLEKDAAACAVACGLALRRFE